MTKTWRTIDRDAGKPLWRGKQFSANTSVRVASSRPRLRILLRGGRSNLIISLIPPTSPLLRTQEWANPSQRLEPDPGGALKSQAVRLTHPCGFEKVAELAGGDGGVFKLQGPYTTHPPRGGLGFG